MDAIKMGVGFGLWQQGMPEAHTLFDDIDKAEAWGIDSLAFYAEEIIPHVEETETPAVSSASTT